MGKGNRRSTVSTTSPDKRYVERLAKTFLTRLIREASNVCVNDPNSGGYLTAEHVRQASQNI